MNQSKPKTEQEARELYVKTARQYLGAVQGDARHAEIIRLYNSQNPLPRGAKMFVSSPWCATFAAVPAIELGWTDILAPECSCGKMIQLYKAHQSSRWEEDDTYMPKLADLAMYYWKDPASGYATTDCTGDPDHVGIVCAISGDDIDVIEGNYSKSVKIRRIRRNGRYIRGWCLPAYHLKATPEAVVPPKDDYLASQDKFDQMLANAILELQRTKAGLPPSDWSADARAFAEGIGLIKGVNGKDDMQYKTYCTREMLAVILLRFAEYLRTP